jgi:selenium metabolism protein YedF
MKFVNAMGDACPIPVVKTKNAIAELGGSGTVETLVDNEIAVQNLEKMAKQKDYGFFSKKLEEGKYRVLITVGEEDLAAEGQEEPEYENCAIPMQGRKKHLVVAVNSDVMGHGDDVLGGLLIKSFIYALSQQDQLPDTILFYNGGAKLTTEDSASLEDLRLMEQQGVEILTCGTCLNYYGLTDQLAVGSVTDMYTVVERLSRAEKVIKL